MTSTIEWCPAAAHAAATRSRVSPGKGMPVDSIRMPRPAAGYPSASTIADQSTGLHILDDPMPEPTASSNAPHLDPLRKGDTGYGDHEVTDDPLQILRHSTAHLLAAAVTELYPGVKYAIGPAIKEPPGFYYDFDFGRSI